MTSFIKQRPHATRPDASRVFVLATAADAGDPLTPSSSSPSPSSSSSSSAAESLSAPGTARDDVINAARTSTTHCEWMSPPLGPLGAFDFCDGRHVFFDERKSQLVVIGSRAENKQRDSVADAGVAARVAYTVPPDYAFGTYYWASVFFLRSDAVLCLLKHHGTRLFSLLTLRLVDDTKTCVVIDETRTDIATQGYQIWSQRVASTRFLFAFTNRRIATAAASDAAPPPNAYQAAAMRQKQKPSSKQHKISKSVSDRALFRDQLQTAVQEEAEQQEEEVPSDSVDSARPSPAPAPARRTVSSGDAAATSAPHDRARLANNKTETEAVMLEAIVDACRIVCRVLCVGRARARLALAPPDTRAHRRAFSDSFRVKQMNRITSASMTDSSLSASGSADLVPFVFSYESDAAGAWWGVFVRRARPTRALLASLRADDAGVAGGAIGALAAAIGSRFIRHPGAYAEECEIEAREGAPAAEGDAVWSNVHVEADKAFMAVQATAGAPVRLWQLSSSSASLPSSAGAVPSLAWLPLALAAPTPRATAIVAMRLTRSALYQRWCIRGTRRFGTDSPKIDNVTVGDTVTKKPIDGPSRIGEEKAEEEADEHFCVTFNDHLGIVSPA